MNAFHLLRKVVTIQVMASDWAISIGSHLRQHLIRYLGQSLES